MHVEYAFVHIFSAIEDHILEYREYNLAVYVYIGLYYVYEFNTETYIYVEY